MVDDKDDLFGLIGAMVHNTFRTVNKVGDPKKTLKYVPLNNNLAIKIEKIKRYF